MTERKAAISERVREELHDHLEDFKKHGPTYIAEYIDSALAGKRGRPHGHIHPKLAEFVRDIVLDVAVMERRPTPDIFSKPCEAALPVPTTRDGRVSVEPSRRKVAA